MDFQLTPEQRDKMLILRETGRKSGRGHHHRDRLGGRGGHRGGRPGCWGGRWEGHWDGPESDDGDDEGQHRRRISRSFYLQTTEVTQRQWKRVMGKNPSQFKDCGEGCPVESVSWLDAQDFIDRLNKIEGTKKYRLPTEAEWEYACRAGTSKPFNTGRCISTDQANFDGRKPLSGCPDGVARGRTVEVALEYDDDLPDTAAMRFSMPKARCRRYDSR